MLVLAFFAIISRIGTVYSYEFRLQYLLPILVYRLHICLHFYIFWSVLFGFFNACVCEFAFFSYYYKMAAQKEIFEKKFNGGWKKVITKAPYKDGFRTDPFLYTPDGKKLRYHMGYFQEINR